jgi:Tfp pilus assembly protein PilE
MTIALVVIVSVLATLGYVSMGYYVVHYRSAYGEMCGIADNLMEKFQEAEGDKTRAENDLKVFKDYLAIIASRQVQAQLTEEQVSHIAQHVAAAMTPKEQMN